MRNRAALKKWLLDDPTHILKLVSHFFGQFFENEFVSRGSDAHLTVAHVLAVMAVPPVLYTLYLIPVYTDIYANSPERLSAYSLIDQCRYVTFSMVVVGFVALLEWDALFLNSRDYAILMPLPLRPAAIFTAKMMALVIFLLLFVLDIGAVPTILYPIVETMGMRGAPMSSWRFADLVMSHGVAVFASGAFAFLFFAAVQGILINVLKPRTFKRASLLIQILGMTTLLMLLFLLPVFSLLVPGWQRHPFAALYRFPPLWFLGLYQSLLGSDDAMFRSAATTGVIAIGLVTLICAASYYLNYRQHAQHILESGMAHPEEPSRLDSATMQVLSFTLLREPLHRASFFFTLLTISRNTRHRLYLATYTGVGIALAAFGLLEMFLKTTRQSEDVFWYKPQPALLAIPLILSFFLLSGMRVVFAFPAELPANWIFRITEEKDGFAYLSGSRKALLTPVIVLLVAFSPLFAYLWGWPIALRQLTFNILLSLIMQELLFVNFRKIPCTCSYQAGKANLTVTGVLYWAAFAMYAYAMASFERWLLINDFRWMAFTLLALSLLIGAVVRRRKLPIKGMIFEDSPNPVIQSLNLSF